MKSRALGLLLTLVLLAHWAGLAWLHAQLQSLQPLVPMADPMFTRLIEPQVVAAPVPSRKSAPQRQAEVPKTLQAASFVADQVPAALATPPEPGAQQQPVEPAQREDPVATAPAMEQPASPEPAFEPGADGLADAQAAADGWPADTRLSYRLTGFYRGDLHGSARVQWQREQSRYQVRVDLSMALVIRVSMISQGEVSDAGLLPRAYEEQFPAGVRRMTIDAGVVTLNDGSQVSQPQAVQDTASQFVELTRRFASGRETLRNGGQVEVWLARPFGVDLWTYDVVGEETLQTPELGPIQAFHLVPRPIARPRGAIKAELWFAPSLQYLPVRVRIALGADNFVDLMVERIEQGGAAPSRATDDPYLR